MIEIFIPTKIKLGENQNLDINIISDNFLYLLNNSFNGIKFSGFDSIFFEGIKLEGEKFNENLVILCNGLFGKHYFADYDFFGDDFVCLGTKIIGEGQITEKIEYISSNIEYIVSTLKSDELLTNTLKDKISFKVKETFFILSGLIFLLYSLKEKTLKNISELEKYDGLVEYEGQSKLLLETAVTKRIELDISIGKIEGKIELFIGIIKKLII